MTISDDVVIAGETVSLTNPCDVAKALRKAQLRLATGGHPFEVEIDGERVRYSNPRNDDLAALISQYSDACARATSSSSGGRRRRIIRF